MKLVTTLQNIKEHNPCRSGWFKLLRDLGENKNFPNLDRRVTLRFILEYNTLEDTWWALRCFPELEKLIKWHAIRCVELVCDEMGGDRITHTHTLDVTRRYLEENATLEELLHAIDEASEVVKIAVKQAREDERSPEWYYPALVAKAVCSVARCAAKEGWGDVYAEAERAVMNAITDIEREQASQELLRLINCYENGIEYTI